MKQKPNLTIVIKLYNFDIIDFIHGIALTSDSDNNLECHQPGVSRVLPKVGPVEVEVEVDLEVPRSREGSSRVGVGMVVGGMW